MTYADALTHHVQRCLRRDFDLPAVEPDADGDYGVAAGETVVWARPILDHDPPLLRLWAPATQRVKRTAALLREINDVNLGLQQMQCALYADVVLISAEVEIELIEPGQLGRLLPRVGQAAEQVGCLIAAVFGGQPAEVAGSEQPAADRE